MRRYIFLILTAVLLGTALFTRFSIEKKRALTENLALKQENQDLLAQIQRFSLPDLKPEKTDFLKARIFSAYPFNIKNEITADAGTDDGIKKLMPATLGENILIGQVKEVWQNSSVIQTIFDPSLEMPVRIGEKEIDGLLKGGNNPKVVLIEKTKPVNTGDIVYSAGSALPYGLKIGEVAEIRGNAVGVFKEAILKMPFNINELREVNIILNPHYGN